MQRRGASLKGWVAEPPEAPSSGLDAAVAAQWELGLLLEGSEGLDERR